MHLGFLGDRVYISGDICVAAFLKLIYRLYLGLVSKLSVDACEQVHVRKVHILAEIVYVFKENL